MKADTGRKKGGQNMNTVNRVDQCFDEMTKSERCVAVFFREHLNDFAFFTLDKLADAINISTTSVIRFCRRLGFAGFKDFQDALRSDIMHQPDLLDKFHRTWNTSMGDELLTQTVHQGIRCIQNTFHTISYETLAESVKLLVKAKRVFTFGMKESYALTHYTYTRLLTVRDNVFILNAGYNGEVEPILSLTEEDVCIVFLFHRYTKLTLQILPLLQKQGTKIILVTSAPFDQVQKYCTVLIPCIVDANGIKNSSLAPICLADYLCNAVAMQNGNATVRYMQQSEKLFDSGAVLGS